MSKKVLEMLKENMLSLDFEAALATGADILNDTDENCISDAVNAVSDTLQIVGKRFQDGDWYLNELVISGEIAKELMELFEPHMDKKNTASLGTVVVGTVAGDLHDLGKNIFISYAKNAGFNIIDLGVDVKTEQFVNAVKENTPVALGLSCLLTFTEKEIGKVIQALQNENLRQNLKIVIGGAALTEKLAEDIGADAFAPDAITGIDKLKTWVA